MGGSWRRLTVGDEERVESPDSDGLVVGTAGQFEALGAAPVHARDLVSVSLCRNKKCADDVDNQSSIRMVTHRDGFENGQFDSISRQASNQKHEHQRKPGFP